MEKLTAQSEVGLFQQDMTVATQQYLYSTATVLTPTASVNSNSNFSSVPQYYENIGQEFSSQATVPLLVNTVHVKTLVALL